MADHQKTQKSAVSASGAPPVLNAHHRTMLAVLAGLTIMFLSAAALTFWVDSSVTSSQGRELRKRPSPLREIPEFINLTITETGIAAITTDDLRPFNWQLSNFSYDTINLTRQGEPVPYAIADDGATMFFLAEAITSTVQAPTVYQLSLGAGLPMAERAAAATGRGSNTATYRQVWEENSTFVADTGSSDPWYGRLLLAPQTTNFTLTNITPNGGRGRLTLSVWSGTAGPSNPDHHLKVVLNGRQLADWVWDGIKQTQLTVELPDGLLRPDGDNVLSVTSPGDTLASGEAIYIDRIDLLYEGNLAAGNGQVWFSSNASTLMIDQADASLLLFDVTDRRQPVRLTHLTPLENGILATGSGVSSRYFALNVDEAIRPSFSNSFIAKQALRQTDRGADYIVIYPDDTAFVDALQPLLAYRAEQGLRVTAVPLSQVYDEFGYGQADPDAIRKFLTYAQNNWRFPSPRYVLLAGDASYDIHNNLDGKNSNLLPSQLVQLPDGFASSDTWYVLPADGQPRLAIGRFPAQTPEQLQVMVAKTLAYEQNGRSDWIERSLFVSEAEPQFDEMNLALAALLQASGYETSTLQMGDDETMHYVLMSTLAKGVGVINYAGDGYVSQWGNGQTFAGDDASMLADNGHTPIFTTFTCNNGAFAEPQRDSLAEDLLWVKNGGIVAAVVPSSQMALPALTPLGELFYSALLDENVHTLGEALLQTQAAALDDEALDEAVLVVNLLGDPALQLQRP